MESLLIVLIAFTLGVYDGFFGPGTGSFLIFLFVKVLGFDFLPAVGAAKVINTATNLASLLLFAATGNVWWRFLVPMAAANVAGSNLGTRLALRHGTGFIRIVFALVTAALILKTGYQAVDKQPAAPQGWGAGSAAPVKTGGFRVDKGHGGTLSTGCYDAYLLQ